MNPKFMDIAKRMAEFGQHPQHKVGSVIVKKNRLVSMGFNKSSTHPRSPHPYKSVHAELSSILKCNREDLYDSIIYVYRQTKNGVPALSRPCKYCMIALKEAGVSSVIYTTDSVPFYKQENI